MLKHTRISDPEVYELAAEELRRQEHNIEMIASESTAPLEVLELSGSIFTNKTLEGYPGKRFQAGSGEGALRSRARKYSGIFRVHSQLRRVLHDPGAGGPGVEHAAGPGRPSDPRQRG